MNFQSLQYLRNEYEGHEDNFEIILKSNWIRRHHRNIAAKNGNGLFNLVFL